MEYILENCISGHVRELDCKDDMGAGQALISEASGCARGSGKGLYCIWNGKHKVAQVRVWDGNTVFWASQSFECKFYAHYCEKRNPRFRPVTPNNMELEAVSIRYGRYETA